MGLWLHTNGYMCNALALSGYQKSATMEGNYITFDILVYFGGGFHAQEQIQRYANTYNAPPSVKQATIKTCLCEICSLRSRSHSSTRMTQETNDGSHVSSLFIGSD